MLEDRSYIRDEPFGRQWPISIVLMVVLVVVFALQEVNGFYFGFPVQHYLALSSAGLLRGYLWQLITFQFLHGGVLHLVFNLIGIYFFGRFVEERLGRAGFLKLYFLSGVAGGLLQALLGLAIPKFFGAPVVGASAGVYGLLTAFALLDPEGVIVLFFVLPVRAKYFIAFAAGIAVFYILVPAEPGIAHAAHMGGMLGAFGYLRWASLLDALRIPRRLGQPRLRPRELMRVSGEKMAAWKRSGKDLDAELSATEFISREVDPILDKISQHGIHSLTPRERQILEAARSKMEKRTRD